MTIQLEPRRWSISRFKELIADQVIDESPAEPLAGGVSCYHRVRSQTHGVRAIEDEAVLGRLDYFPSYR
jgi:hypothetical protein